MGEENQYVYTDHIFFQRKTSTAIEVPVSFNESYGLTNTKEKEEGGENVYDYTDQRKISTGVYSGNVPMAPNQAYGVVSGRKGEEIGYKYTTPTNSGIPSRLSEAYGDGVMASSNPAYGVVTGREEETGCEHTAQSNGSISPKHTAGDVTVSSNQAYGLVTGTK